MSALSVRALAKSFGATAALSGVDLEARPGEVHAVLGENGAGKSTLMGVLSGLIPRDAGALALGGMAYAPRSPADARAAGVALVSQEHALCTHLTVAENVMLGREPRRRGLVDRGAMERETKAVMDELLGDAAKAGRAVPAGARVSDLPVAEQQLVEIARALAQGGGCKLLILDEPTSSLGRDDAERLFAMVRGLRARGVTILYVSHFLEEVFALADRFTVLRDGKTVGAGDIAASSIPDVVAMMAGRRVDELFVRSERARGEPMLTVSGLRGAVLPREASLTVHRGEVVGISGLVGAGRTELLRALFGLAEVKAGRVKIGAFEGVRSPRASIGRGVGFLSEDRKAEGLALRLTIAENTTLSRLAPVERMGLLSPSRAAAAASRWMKELAVKARAPDQPVGELSGGNQQKVALARLLHQEADLFLLDEPTRGIDVGSKVQIYAAIDGLAKAGKAVLLVSSYVPELLGVCDRIAVMHKGTLGPARPHAEWTPHDLVAAGAGVAT